MRNQQQHSQFGYWTEDEKEGYDYNDDYDDDDDDDEKDVVTTTSLELLDHASSLERVAYIALYLLQELQSSSEEVSAIAMMGSTSTTTTTNSTNSADSSSSNKVQQPLPSLNDDASSFPSAAGGAGSGINSVIIEKSKYLMKLSPRIRRLESDAVKCLVGRLETALLAMRTLSEEEEEEEESNGGGDGGGEEDEGEYFFYSMSGGYVCFV
jgi:hypothetical protein